MWPWPGENCSVRQVCEFFGPGPAPSGCSAQLGTASALPAMDCSMDSGPNPAKQLFALIALANLTKYVLKALFCFAFASSLAHCRLKLS